MADSVAATTRPPATPAEASGRHAARDTSNGISFGEVLSCLNPLQYLPVVGTIYRAVTGDEIPAGIREAGSLAVSFLTGGPVGVGISVATDLAERAVGFDPESAGRHLLAALGIGGSAAGTAATATDAVAVTGAAAATASAAAAAAAGAALDADTLNGMELRRLASAAYARTGALAA